MIRVAILADMPVSALEHGSNGRGGGHAATWLPQLAQEFSKQQDLAISWVILSKVKNAPKISHWFGQTFYEIPKGIMTLDILTGHRIAGMKLKKVLDSISPDVIHVWGSEGSYPSVLQGTCIPSIMSMQGILSEYNRIGSFKDNWRMRIQAKYEKAWIKKAGIITTESQWGIDMVKQISPSSDCRMIEYGVNPSFYQVSWKPDPSKPFFMFSGGLDWRKGFDLLLEALTIPPNPSWKLWIAGNGPMIGELNKRRLPQAVFLGNMKWSEMQDYMSRAWALILPTRADTSPNAVKEARVLGLPVITSLHGGQSSYVKNGKNGIIVEPLTAKGIRRAMDLLAGNFQQTTAMGRCCHKEDREFFQPAHTAQAFASLYREIASSKRPKNKPLV